MGKKCNVKSVWQELVGGKVSGERGVKGVWCKSCLATNASGARVVGGQN